MTNTPFIAPAEWWHFVLFFIGLAVLGGLGGLLAEIRLVIGKASGTVEKPRPSGRTRYDLGVWANILIGSGAALTATYFFPPTTFLVGEGDDQTTATGYPVYTIVPLALILGLAGSAVLSAASARALAAANGEAKENTKKAADTALEEIQRTAAADDRSPLTTEQRLSAIASAAGISRRTILAIGGNSPGDEDGAV